MIRSIIHVDMDAFYAAVEIRDRPELAGQPVVVGARPEQRGVVAAASYAARVFGIHSAMPSKTAVRLCPQIIFLPARHDYYGEISAQIHLVFERYTPLVEPLALDEAFLDVTASQRLWGDAAAIGRRIKNEIQTELGLTASVGIAPNKFVAKIASDLEKPDGFVVVEPDDVQATLDPLPITRIWGVGRAGEKQLRKLGIEYVHQLRLRPAEELRLRFGEWGTHIWRLANGLDRRDVVADSDAKSISHETTFRVDIDDIETLSDVLLELTQQVAMRLRRHHRRARTVQIKIRFEDFRTITRAHTLTQSSDITHEIWQAAQTLLRTTLNNNRAAVRLLGVGVSALGEPESEQADLFQQSQREQQRDLDTLADEINSRFGTRAVHRGLKKERS